MSPANQLSSLKKVNFSGAFQWFCIGSSPWPHLWSFSRMTITDYFIKERSDQNLPYHNLSAILSSGRQFEASYIKYVLRNGRAQSFHDAGLPRQWQVITCPDSTPWARISGGNLGPKLNGSVRSNRKVSKKRVRLLRWTTFPGRTGWNFVWMDRAHNLSAILSCGRQFEESYIGRDPFNQHSDRSDREKRTTSKGGPVFSKLFRLDRTDPLSFRPKFPEILVEWIAPIEYVLRNRRAQ